MFSFIDPTLLCSLVSVGGDSSGQSTNSGGLGSWTFIIIIVLMIAMFFVMSIPQRKREKKVKEMLDSLKPGDRVRTIGGMYGTVTNIKQALRRANALKFGYNAKKPEQQTDF